jgi:hypothetical protein
MPPPEKTLTGLASSADRTTSTGGNCVRVGDLREAIEHRQ